MQNKRNHRSLQLIGVSIPPEPTNLGTQKMSIRKIEISGHLADRLVNIAKQGAFGQAGRELANEGNVDALVDNVIAFYINFSGYEKTTSAS